ncbi:MAG: hemolysin family protein [Akkermansia sp.]|nr:hemolysin family protein [Akkermansia sp.]
MNEGTDPLSSQAASGAALFQFPGLGEILLFLAGIVFFLFLNAFFVANEFSSVRVRESQLLDNEDDSPRLRRRRARARDIVRHLDTYLSANQVGITFASLALGFLGEPLVERLVAPALYFVGMRNTWGIHIISLVLAYSLFTFAHVVLGELVPKSLAIRHPLPLALATAPWLQLFDRLLGPIINLFNGTANLILRKLFGIDPSQQASNPHSADELAHLVEESERSQALTETEAEISKNALGLNDKCVADILTPRNATDVLDIQTPFETNWERVCNSRHTRFPLVDGHLDNVLGWVHVKDLLKLAGRHSPDLMSVKRDIKVVPDSMKLDTLLNFFLKERTHFALVVDEFGDTLGVVFLDDVLEEIVGDDIQDEFDDDVHEFLAMNDGTYIANGSVTLYDLEEYLPDLHIDCPGISTLGGYVTNELGHLPEEGETLETGHYTLSVTGADGRRVTQVKLVRQEAAPAPERAE